MKRFEGGEPNDPDVSPDAAMRAVVDRTGLDRQTASSSQMGRFETGWLTSETNLAALGDLSGAWIDRVHARRPTCDGTFNAIITRLCDYRAIG